MPPKSSAGKEKDLANDEEVLQAVILADSFNKRFRPLTVGKPRCLLPICNATLLDWTFESLALAGVQEIFVICRSYADLVKKAIRESKWSRPSSGLKIVPIITAKETFSPGDAMRDIYTHGIITSDFVLVMGDLVSNIRIDEVVRAHKERRRTNKDAIMTMVVKESGLQHRTKPRGESGVFVLDPDTSECLHYEPVIGYPPKTHARIPREILAEHPELDIRNDLIDCCIDVCSAEVPSLFQDNFDYADIRRDFVYGVLTSDLLMKNIHCYIAKEGYAARVADTRSYGAISKDILSRWTFPLVPDNNHPGGHAYEHLRGNKYIAKDNTVVMSRTARVGSNTLIGAHTTIADGASISGSVIGQRCKIGPGAVLKGAYIFDDTEIGADTLVENSIVGSGVRIGEGSTVRTGCLIADGVVLGKNARLARFDRISRRRDLVDGESTDGEEDEEEWEMVEARTNICLGSGSNAVVWPQSHSEEEDEEIDEVESYNNQRLMRMGDTASDLDLSDAGSVTEDESDSEDEDDASSIMNGLSRTSSMTSVSLPDPSVSTIHNLQASAAESEFRSEVKQSLDRAFAEEHSVDNASVELKTLRMASNVPLRRVRESVVEAIVERIPIVEGDPGKQRTEIAKMVARWGPLIDRIGGIDPVETVEVLANHCAQSTRLPLFGQILAALYQADIVDEDDIRAWHVRPSSKGEGYKPDSHREGLEKCWNIGKMMIEQFDEQESDDESGEDEEEEEEVKADSRQAHAKAESSEEESEEEGAEEESEEESEEGSEEGNEGECEEGSDESEEEVHVAKTAVSEKTLASGDVSAANVQQTETQTTILASTSTSTTEPVVTSPATVSTTQTAAASAESSVSVDAATPATVKQVEPAGPASKQAAAVIEESKRTVVVSSADETANTVPSGPSTSASPVHATVNVAPGAIQGGRKTATDEDESEGSEESEEESGEEASSSGSEESGSEGSGEDSADHGAGEEDSSEEESE
ncbi:nucleotide-diphospho-sugar transferase [Fomitopsis serialis]|uniref:nucleotide-diphospho-sugar transferase n=1 Tax=Fomitopsis serialis TaxID=139415 RepID=UPI002008DAA3|nr:nucleotide-diphospho-sugar transferase [Neoantrodia serialis]KAH9934642.1 nucleotide-diphospho-sugar transferase [Neoantrodia serialis]